MWTTKIAGRWYVTGTYHDPTASPHSTYKSSGRNISISDWFRKRHMCFTFRSPLNVLRLFHYSFHTFQPDQILNTVVMSKFMHVERLWFRSSTDLNVNAFCNKTRVLRQRHMWVLTQTRCLQFPWQSLGSYWTAPKAFNQNWFIFIWIRYAHVIALTRMLYSTPVNCLALVIIYVYTLVCYIQYVGMLLAFILPPIIPLTIPLNNPNKSRSYPCYLLSPFPDSSFVVACNSYSFFPLLSNSL